MTLDALRHKNGVDVVVKKLQPLGGNRVGFSRTRFRLLGSPGKHRHPPASGCQNNRPENKGPPVHRRSMKSRGIFKLFHYQQIAISPQPRRNLSPPPQIAINTCGTRIPNRWRNSMKLEQLVFVGLNGYAVALDRDTGEIVWSNNQLKSGYVTFLLDGDRLIVSTNGYIYCLDPLTGDIRWHNPMKGYGIGAPTSLISVRGQSSQILPQFAAAAQARHSASDGGAGSTMP